MTPTTVENVERWLFEQGGWVTTGHICERWDISDRRLRLLGSSFLISRNAGGYIHRYHATPQELEAYCGPLRAHTVSQWKKIKTVRRLYRERARPTALADATAIQPDLLP